MGQVSKSVQGQASGKGRNTELWVGIFVLASLVAGGAVLFIIGNQANLFTPKTEFEAAFKDADGLRAGSPIRIAGVDVGTVTEVHLEDDGSTRIIFSIVRGADRLVREGSTAIIGSKGMLGDKQIDLSVGEGPALEAGSRVRTEQPPGLTDYVKTAGDLIDSAQRTLASVEKATAAFGDDSFSTDVKAMAANMAKLTNMATNEGSALGRLMTDQAMGADLKRGTAGMAQASVELSKTLREVQSMTAQARKGPGLLHALLYGEGGEEVVQHLGAATGELAATLRQVREGNGGLHQLIYSEEAGQLVTDLAALSASLRTVGEGLENGEGSLGAMLADPSLYEDMKALVGNLERNRVLKALVRYSIRNGDSE